MAKDALGGALSSEHLTIGGRKWKLRRGKDDTEGDILSPTVVHIQCQRVTIPNVSALPQD